MGRGQESAALIGTAEELEAEASKLRRQAEKIEREELEASRRILREKLEARMEQAARLTAER